MVRSRNRGQFLAIAPATCIAACGGGGGGSGSPPVVQPPPPPPSAGRPVALTTANAVEAILEMGVTTDAAFTLSTATLSRLLDYMATGPSSESCDLQGTVTTSLDDADANGIVSVGDTFRVQYSNGCYEIDMNDFVTGTVTLLINELDFANGGGYLIDGRMATSTNFRADDTLYENTLSGLFDLLSFSAPGVFIQEVELVPGTTAAITWVQLAVPDETNSTEVTEFVARKTFRVEADPAQSGLLFELHLALDSGLLGGTIECDSPTPAPDPIDSYPAFGGYLECTGASNSRARTVGDTITASPSDRILVDSGSGTLVEVDRVSRSGLRLEWLFERSVFGSGPPPEANTFEDVASTRLPIEITDSAYDGSSGRLFIVDSTDLIAIDVETLTEVGRLTLVDFVSTMALSEDGSTLWLAARDKPEIRSVNTANMSYQDLVAYTSPGPVGSSSIQYVYDLEVVPGTTHSLIATLNHRNEIVMFSDGVELPGILPLQSATRGNFAVQDANTLVANGGTQSLDSDLRVASIDLVDGLVLQSALTNYVPGSAGLFAADSSTVIAGNRVIDLDRESVSGELETLNVVLGSKAVDSSRDRIYAIRNSSQLLVYELSTRRLVGAYFLDRFSLGAMRGVHVAEDQVLFAYEGVVLKIPASDLGQNRGLEACVKRDFSGLALPGLALQFDCEIESVVYDHSRERLLVGFGADNGHVSYSVGVLEPQTGVLEAVIPVGGNPGKIRLTQDNQSLIVSLVGANEIAIVDLATLQVTGYQSLGIRNGSSSGPAISTSIALLGGGADDFLAALTDGAVSRYVNGSSLADTHVGEDPYVDLFAANDGLAALAVLGDQSSMLDIASTGVAEREDLGGVFSGPLTKRNQLQQFGDDIFVFNGDVFDLASGTISTPCTIENAQDLDQIAIPSSTAESVIYVRVVNVDLEVAFCDRATGITEALRPISYFPTGTGPILVGGHSNSAGLLMIASTEWLLVVDPFQ